MALSNPFKTSSSHSFSNVSIKSNPLLQLTNYQLTDVARNQLPKFDERQFRSMLPNLTESHLQSIVAQARLRGISEKEIEDGLNLIQQLQTQN